MNDPPQAARHCHSGKSLCHRKNNVSDAQDAHWKPKYNPWLIALTVTLATFMEVLDTSIANVSLPHIAGNLSASQEESTWVLTSYLVSNAIILPISAWLSTIIGRKRFYMTCVALFTTSSFLCGLAPSLGMLIFFRVLQGVGGGGLQPSEQAILADTFPASKRGMAFAVYGMAVVLAPAIGPTLGGYITDNFSWRWIFYVNVPVGLLSLFLTNRLVEDPPFLKREQERRRGIRADYVGLGLLTLAIASLQIALDKGQESDWFSSRWITALVITAAYAFVVWIVWEWHHPNPVVDIRMFKRRNFATAMFFSFTVGIVLYGTTVMIPQFLQVQLGYPAVVAGEALAGGGFVMICVLPFVGTMVSRVDPRKMMAFGFVSISAAMYYMSTLFSLTMDFRAAFLMRTLQMFGLAFIFVPQNVLAYVGVPREKNNQISSMNSFMRNVGGSIGIALISTSIARIAQRRRYSMVAHTTPGTPPYESLVAGLAKTLQGKGASSVDATRQAHGLVSFMIDRQATTLAYVEVISILAVIILCLVPFLLIMRRNRPAVGEQTAVH
jgi:DHA2 family multidrug resistance protein